MGVPRGRELGRETCGKGKIRKTEKLSKVTSTLARFKGYIHVIGTTNLKASWKILKASRSFNGADEFSSSGRRMMMWDAGVRER